MKTLIQIQIIYGEFKILFKKDFDFSFIPSFGMRVIDMDEKGEIVIALKNEENYSTVIDYYPKHDTLVITIGHEISLPLPKTEFMRKITPFISMNWQRLDTQDLDKFCQVMEEDIIRKAYGGKIKQSINQTLDKY